MIPTFVSAPAEPRERGRQFGAANAARIAANAELYEALFRSGNGADADAIASFALRTLDCTRGWSPALAEEIEGMAEGAELPLESVMALNARTELAALTGVFSSECSTVIALGEEGAAPVAMQCWDWFQGMAGSWLIWTIEHPGGHLVHTLTEYGIVGKVGINSTGLGTLINILLHERDAESPGVPVHVVARGMLDEPGGLAASLQRIGTAEVAASTCISVVAAAGTDKTGLAVEVHPGGPSYVLPDDSGLLVHTNHFLAPKPAMADRAPRVGPDSYVRYDVLRRRLRGLASPSPEQVLEAMSCHFSDVCRHSPDASAQHEPVTLATLRLDPLAKELRVKRGGPCEDGEWTTAGAVREAANVG